MTSLTKSIHAIQGLYRAGIEDEISWKQSLEKFHADLSHTNDPAELELALIADENWELAFDERSALLEKRFRQGDFAKWFLQQYYEYHMAHLDSADPKFLEYQQKLIEVKTVDA